MTMQCQCGNFFTPRYTKQPYSREDDMCDSCRGFETFDVPLTGEEIIKINLDEYNKELLGDDYE